MAFEPDPNFGLTFDRQNRRVVRAMAEADEEALRDHLRAGPRSGQKYSSLPRRSSAAGEYPQEQEGDLIDGVFSQELPDGDAEVGIANNPMEKLERLEFAPAIAGGRKPLAKNMLDADTRQRRARAIQQAGREAGSE